MTVMNHKKCKVILIKNIMALDGWMVGWVDGWAGLRIAHNNQQKWHFKCQNLFMKLTYDWPSKRKKVKIGVVVQVPNP